MHNNNAFLHQIPHTPHPTLPQTTQCLYASNVGVRITKVCKWRSCKKNWRSNFNTWWTSRLHLLTKWPLTLDQQFHFIHQYVHRVNHPTTPEILCRHKFLSIHHFHPLVLHFKAYIHCCDKFHPSNDFIHHYTYTLKHTSIVVIDFIWKWFILDDCAHQLNGHHHVFHLIKIFHLVTWFDGLTQYCVVYGEVSTNGKNLLPIKKIMDKWHIFFHLQYLDGHFVFNISLVFTII